MSDSDKDAPFLQDLPRLNPDARLRFDCHPQVPCFNACCHDLDLELHPYDVLLLREVLGLSSAVFVERFGALATMPRSGFPVMQLKMVGDAERRCPFVRSSGCAVYESRPAACRSYPVGRGARLDAGGELVEQLCLVREQHCRGFEQPRDWTAMSWLQDQGFREHVERDDRYMSLMARHLRRHGPLAAARRPLVAFAVYQVDRFGEEIESRGLPDGVEVSAEREAAIRSDERERLAFALDWLEHLLLSEQQG